MTEQQRREGARLFYQKWAGRGREDEDDRSYWLDILERILGVDNATDHVDFQKKVVVDGNTKRIDAYIPETRIIIEQKSLGIPLDKKIHQSGDIFLTPYEQAKRYNDNLPYEEKARWIVTSNFAEIWIYDMNARVPEPVKITIDDLQSKYSLLDFLIRQDKKKLTLEMQVSVDAGRLVGRIYDALYKQYIDPESERSQKSLNMLCVRLVFCLYCEDAGIFGGSRTMFHDYLERFDAADIRGALINLFRVFDTAPNMRDPYDSPELLKFPYVNGGLFADKNIEIPNFTDEIKNVLLEKASDEFDWSAISPTIFGAVFESTLNPETRRSGGMHYTSIENIHKVIDPLFLDDLRSELNEIKEIDIERTRTSKLKAFQQKLASLSWLDPAAGSGNFLTETYISIRRLENEVINELSKGQMVLGEVANPIQVSINQFYGIEINDFAVTVAKAALWIAESQMMKETEDIVHMQLDFLPLKTNAHIVEGNALRLDWEDVVPREKLNYIMGNPPFVGYSLQSKDQKSDILEIYVNENGKPYKTAGKIDYVSGWYFKAARIMYGTNIRTAFVSTNSITQGEQVVGVWKPLYGRFGIHIDFAYRTFRWDSEASAKAHVHCVIVGFSSSESKRDKVLYITDEKQQSVQAQTVERINAYLLNAPDVFVENRSKAICDVPEMTTGNRPADGGHLIIEADEYDDFIAKEPRAITYIKKLIGSAEFINNKKRWCLWLVGISPTELRQMPYVMQRVAACKEDRENAPDLGRRKLADRPAQFREIKNPESYIVVPATSSERRRYIPLGFMDKDTIATNAVIIIPDATLYHFGVLTSNVHMAWMRAACGRLKSDYRYSKDIVYNNFPWPGCLADAARSFAAGTGGSDESSPYGGHCNAGAYAKPVTPEQKAAIERTAQGILDARALYPDSSLADLYDELTMPPELRRAHAENDRAVMAAYGFSVKDTSEESCVAALMKMYQSLTNAQ